MLHRPRLLMATCWAISISRASPAGGTAAKLLTKDEARRMAGELREAAGSRCGEHESSENGFILAKLASPKPQEGGMVARCFAGMLMLLLLAVVAACQDQTNPKLLPDLRADIRSCLALTPPKVRFCSTPKQARYGKKRNLPF